MWDAREHSGKGDSGEKKCQNKLTLLLLSYLVRACGFIPKSGKLSDGENGVVVEIRMVLVKQAKKYDLWAERKNTGSRIAGLLL